MDELLSTLKYIMLMIVSSCQHFREQQLRTLSCIHYTIFSVVKLDLFIRALLLDHILVRKKIRVRLAYILFQGDINRHTVINNVNKFVMSSNVSIRYFPQSPNSFSPKYVKFIWIILTTGLNLITI